MFNFMLIIHSSHLFQFNLTFGTLLLCHVYNMFEKLMYLTISTVKFLICCSYVLMFDSEVLYCAHMFAYYDFSTLMTIKHIDQYTLSVSCSLNI